MARARSDEANSFRGRTGRARNFKADVIVRTLRSRSEELFGYGPKTLERILRFQRVLTLVLSSIETHLVDCALQAIAQMNTTSHWDSYSGSATFGPEIAKPDAIVCTLEHIDKYCALGKVSRSRTSGS